MNSGIPKNLHKYFWGDDVHELNWDTHRKYIIETILNKSDIEGVSWLFTQINQQELLDTLDAYKLSAKSRNFWEIYLS